MTPDWIGESGGAEMTYGVESWDTLAESKTGLLSDTCGGSYLLMVPPVAATTTGGPRATGAPALRGTPRAWATIVLTRPCGVGRSDQRRT